ncbi:helix-turn-helix transcriptional regulator [Streptomyces hirsutus]|uniref:helix-turn-helix transcriptional regulator n=1 Tax=Streptomyces hirsutus TaxID=35620 RepID=UPI0006E43B53|nr:helix-turn-helix transcriptional regulator [Streptomyces hirsutus]
MNGNTHGNAPAELCEGDLDLYTRALRQGRVPADEADGAAHLVGLGLLNPALDDPSQWEPVAPHIVLHRLLRASADRIAGERRREERLVEALEPLMRAGRHDDVSTTSLITLHSGRQRIDRVIDEAMADAGELLAIQPHKSYTHPKPDWQEAAIRRDQALLDRGGRIRALYQHTVRHSPTLAARYERLTGDVEARTLDEITERLIVVDRAVAFVPADTDRTSALEVRHPALVRYLATTFDRLWRLATPMYPQAVRRPTLNGVTPRQRAIAALLVEGHTDAVIADRLGMNVRTARVHIAKIATTLGSGSRAQLGYLIGQSGILDQES